jgi:hypothetical protein
VNGEVDTAYERNYTELITECAPCQPGEQCRESEPRIGTEVSW